MCPREQQAHEGKAVYNQTKGVKKVVIPFSGRSRRDKKKKENKKNAGASREQRNRETRILLSTKKEGHQKAEQFKKKRKRSSKHAGEMARAVRRRALFETRLRGEAPKKVTLDA